MVAHACNLSTRETRVLLKAEGHLNATKKERPCVKNYGAGGLGCSSVGRVARMKPRV